MPENNQGQEGNQNQEPKTYTEDEYKAGINAAVKSRLAKFADYDELKAQVAELGKAASESEANKKRAEAAEAKVAAYEAAEARRKVVAEVAREVGKPAEDVALLAGDDHDTLLAAAKAIWPAYTPGREGMPTGAKDADGMRELARNLFQSR